MSRSARAVVSRTFVSAVSPSFAGGGTATSSSSFPRPRGLLLLLLLPPPPSRPFPQSSPVVPGKWRIFAPSLSFPFDDDDDDDTNLLDFDDFDHVMVLLMVVDFSSPKTSKKSLNNSSSSKSSSRIYRDVVLRAARAERLPDKRIDILFHFIN